MPGSKKVPAQTPVTRQESLIEHLLGLRPAVENELKEDHPDRVKAGLNFVSRGIQHLSDSLDIERQLERPNG